MDPQASAGSVGGNEQVVQGDDCDLNQLARQTLTSVPANLLPPEPFPSGFDLGALASTRSSHPPAVDTESRLDLRSMLRPPVSEQRPPVPPKKLPARKRSAVVDLAPEQSNSRASALRRRLPARKRTVVDLAPAPVAQPQSQPQPQAQPKPQPQPTENELELDALIAARGFSGTAWSEHVARAAVVAKQAPNWAWGAGGALLVGLAWLMSAASGTSHAVAPAPVAAAAIAPSVANTWVAPVTALSSIQFPHAAVASAPRIDAYDRARPARSSASASATSAAQPAREQPQAPVLATSPEERTLDTLLDEALRREGSLVPASYAQRAKGSGLAPLPSRAVVADIFGRLVPRMHVCAGSRNGGVAIAHVVVRKDGQVTNVRVTGAGFTSTAAGSCMESVLRSARFPAFEQPTFSVTYPFQL